MSKKQPRPLSQKEVEDLLGHPSNGVQVLAKTSACFD